MRGLWLVFAAWSAVVLAGTTDDAIPDARYRAYGKTFAPYTCRLAGFNTEGQPQVGTCTLIAPHWALTAAHVVADMTSIGVLSDAGYHRVDRVFVHVDWADVFAKDDIALVHVVKPFELKRYPPLTDGTEQLGSVVTAAGYGVTGRLSEGYTRGDAEIRAGTMRLTSTEASVYVCEIRRGGSPLPFCIAPGDSGGPLWGTAADGRTVLIGVNSYTSKKGTGSLRSRVGEESGHTRVSLYREWIAEIAGPLDTPCNLAGCQPQ
jgi:secreted trypsin-like serine protease